MSRKTVLVTGASRGIGKSIAIRFAKEGYNLIINCRQNKKQLLDTKEAIESYNVSCLALVGDMGDYNEAVLLFEQGKKTYGTIDVLINNAGISYMGLLTDMSPSDWDNIITTNLTSLFNCCSLAATDMIKQKAGKIINISSVWGVHGASCEVAYSTSKGGINAFTKALAKELAPCNIQVNAIACGAIDTEMNHFLDEDDLQNLINDIPAGRLGRTEEVADLVYYLASNNQYLTGQIVGLDGGWM